VNHVPESKASLKPPSSQQNMLRKIHQLVRGLSKCTFDLPSRMNLFTAVDTTQRRHPLASYPRGAVGMK